MKSVCYEMEKRMRGIKNYGNTCYINSILQCLSSCKDIVVGLEDIEEGMGRHLYSILNDLCDENENENENGGLGLVNDKKMRAFMMSFHEKVRDFFNVMEQNDVHETLMLLFDRIGNECKTDMDMVKVRRIWDKQLKLSRNCDKAWNRSFSNDHSFLTGIIFGQNVTQIKCGNGDCGKIHHNYEVFNILDVPIVCSDLGGCIRDIFKKVYVKDWTCDKCNEKKRSEKVTMLWRVPKVMFVCVKRFGDDLKKNSEEIDIPLEIDMQEYMIGKKEEDCSRYKLLSVINHYGSMVNGHYNVMMRDKGYIDDDMVYTNMKDIDKKAAYMVVYTWL